jgi:hydroxymethylpyrimidine/phosphomethylpyrimidine kinase
MKPSVLVFAGADPGGGAGIQADNQAIAALGAHPLTVITALTVQDNDRVFAVHPVAADLIQKQAQALIRKIPIAAVKIGIVGNADNAQAIAEIIKTLRQNQPDLPVVLDPVLGSGHGDSLAVGNAVKALAPLFELATLMTPNLPEAQALCGGERRAETQVEQLWSLGCEHVLIKGGHGTQPSNVINTWYAHEHYRSWIWARLPGEYHGSGCTLASANAALLAQGKRMEEALHEGQVYTQRALERAYAIADGQLLPNRFGAIQE